ncbi:MAG: DUF3857 domain-containing protein [Chitinophagaceae bacterium]
MRLLLRTVVTVAILLWQQNYLSAQEKSDIKFGKPAPEAFNLSAYKFDTTAGAVCIADIGTSDFEGNKDGFFSLIFKRQVRIKILNKNGFDAASFKIWLYENNDSEEKLEKLKAITYNLENGKVVETKLEDKSVFKDKVSNNWSVKKFTLPAVKDGSIIEVTYSIKSDFLFNLRPWEFQGQYPRLWSEYTANIPDYFSYVFLTQGFHPFHIRKDELTFKTYTIMQNNNSRGQDEITLSSNVIQSRWVMKNVPALKEESFTTTMGNYVSKIEFQLSEYKQPLEPKQFMGDWNTFSESLLKREDFGQAINKANNWLDDDIKKITAGATTYLEKAKKIYAYVRDNFTCTNANQFTLNDNLKNVFKKRNGTVGDINLLLIAMLQHEAISAAPVLLSTREHGFTHQVYPLIDRFNYVIAGCMIDNRQYYLDATEPKLGFGKLPIRCYNGHARLINNESPNAVFFVADSLREQKMTTVFITNDDKGKLVSALTSKLGYYESLALRGNISQKGKDELLKSIKAQYPSEFELGALEIDSLDNTEQSVQIRYNIDLSGFQEDIAYFNPMLAEGYKDNYFKSVERFYPVEMPYAFDEVFVFNMEIPKGYVVDELPKSAKINFNDTQGSFEYLISNTGTNITLRSRVRLNRATFMPEDYEGLRGFFDYIVKKHGEQIVFKKKK